MNLQEMFRNRVEFASPLPDDYQRIVESIVEEALKASPEEIDEKIKTLDILIKDDLILAGRTDIFGASIESLEKDIRIRTKGADPADIQKERDIGRRRYFAEQEIALTIYSSFPEASVQQIRTAATMASNAIPILLNYDTHKFKIS